jgi:hypothetical protein
LTVLGLFILFLGILLGPTIGRERLISYQVNAQYVSTTSFFDPTLGVVFLNKPQTVTDFEFQSETGVVDYNTSLMITNNETFTTFFESYENMTQNYYDGNITYQQLLGIYSSEVTNTKENSIVLTKLIGEENEIGFYFELNSTDIEEPVFLLAVIDEWNVTESFIYEVSIIINYLILREYARIEGIILDMFGLVLIAFDQLILPKIEEKRKSARIEKSADQS